MSVRTHVVAVAGSLVIRALGATWRVETAGAEHAGAERRRPGNVIYAFWHGRLLPLVHVHRGRGACVLASQHADGEMLGRTIRRLGYGHVRGSSTRGGTRAILELVDMYRAGHDVGLTVDGPRGPRHVVKPGIIEIAKLTGGAIVPVTSASRRHKTFSSWDRFELPYPGTRVVVRYGSPVTVPAGADREVLESKRLEVERALIALTEEADRDARA